MSQFRRNNEVPASTVHKRQGTPKKTNSSLSKTNKKSKTPTSRSRNPFFNDSNITQSVRVKDQLNSTNTSLLNFDNSKNLKNNRKSYRIPSSNTDNLFNTNRQTKKTESNKSSKVKIQKDPNLDFLSFLTEEINIRSNKEKRLDERKGMKKKVLICSNLISIQHYYLEDEKESEQLPLKGTLISKINNVPIMKLKHTINNENYNSNLDDSSNEYLKKDNKKTKDVTLQKPVIEAHSNEKKDDQNCNLINADLDPIEPHEEELQFVIPLLVSPKISLKKPKKNNQEKPTLYNNTDELVSSLFADDGVPISFFDFDFATSYVLNNCEVMPEEDPHSYFPTFSQLNVHKDVDLEENGTVESIVKTLFRSDFESKIEDKSSKDLDANFTSLLSPSSDDMILDSQTNEMTAISPSSFFDFCFGEKTSDFSPDRLHIFTWHNLGIPASQIAKNLILYVTSPNDHLSAQIEMKGIVQYLLIWMKYFPKDFEDKSNRCADVIMQLTRKLITKLKLPNSNVNIIRALIEGLAEGTITSDDFQPQISLPTFKTLDLNKNSKLIQLIVDPCILSAHLTYIDLQMIHKLQRNEFVHSKWRNRPEESPNFQNLMKHFNQTVEFIITSILVDSEKRRARNISYWIKIMYHSKKTRNYHLLAAIDAALSSLPILRLNNSWKLVNENALLAFQKLHNFFKTTKNQEEMFAKPSNTIPFIGVFVSQLDQLGEDEYKTTLQSGEMAYDLVFQRKTLSIIEEIFLPWGVSLSFELDNDILDMCKDLDGKMTNPNDMLEASLKYETMRYSEKTLLDDFFVRKQ